MTILNPCIWFCWGFLFKNNNFFRKRKNKLQRLIWSIYCSLQKPYDVPTFFQIILWILKTFQLAEYLHLLNRSLCFQKCRYLSQPILKFQGSYHCYSSTDIILKNHTKTWHTHVSLHMYTYVYEFTECIILIIEKALLHMFYKWETGIMISYSLDQRQFNGDAQTVL